MLLSLNLLKQFVKTDASAKDIADRITLSLTEVESLEKRGNDTILEIENKGLTHRPDCFSHLGIAREVSAYLNAELDSSLLKSARKNMSVANAMLPLTINKKHVDQDFCSRYTAVVLTDIAVGPSPAWLSETLEHVGIRPINNVVDITNYVMIELGQPLHAFDYEKVEGPEIQVRKAKHGETITTLDGKKRTLSKSMLIIADSKKPIGIAGIVGGANSEVTGKTSTIILEAATFDAKNNRKTSSSLHVRTEASTRFEKRLDSSLPPHALHRAVSLLIKHAGAKIACNPIDIQHAKNRPATMLNANPAWINQFLGTQIPVKKMISILKSLGAETGESKGRLQIRIPTWRPDITLEADIAEEIARIYGYDNIPTTLPSQTDFMPVKNKDIYWRRRTTQLLASYGYYELSTAPFVGDALLAQSGLSEHEHLQLQNPLTSDQKYMRRSLFPHLFSAIAENKPRVDTVRLFEINKLFVPQGKKQPLEPFYLSAVSTKDSFRAVKGHVEDMLRRLHITEIRFAPYPEDCGIYDNLLNGRQTAQIYREKKPFGVVGYIHPRVASSFDISPKTICFEIHMGTIADHASTTHTFRPIPDHPAIIEDITISLAPGTTIGETIQKWYRISALISHIELVTEYSGNYTLRVTFQHHSRNLTEKEVGIVKKKLRATV